MERTRKIVITKEENEYLQKIFRCSNVTVWEAVTYRKNNEIHRKIRKAAIERGNVPMVTTPEFDTIFMTNRMDADREMKRYMIQTFANGATLEGCLSNGEVSLRDRYGTVVKIWSNPTITELRAIQEVAQSQWL